jgi:elongation factor Ts
MSITTEQIKELRTATGAGVLDCRKALEEAGGDFDKALVALREKGKAKAAKRAERVTTNGVVDLYSHGEGRIGVMVEVNCETDFVARTDDFRAFAHEIALQVAGVNPTWLAEADVPEDILDKERKIARNKALEEGKPENVIDRIVEGYLNKFYEEHCLLSQPYIRDEDKTVEQMLEEIRTSTGENINIRRFMRWSVGEELE